MSKKWEAIISYKDLNRFDKQICFELKNLAFEEYRKNMCGPKVKSFEEFSISDEYIKITGSKTGIKFTIASFDEIDVLSNIRPQNILFSEFIRENYKFIKDIELSKSLKKFDRDGRLGNYFNFFEDHRNRVTYIPL